MHHLKLVSSIFDHLNEIIYVSDPDNNLLYINKAGEQLTGRPAGEVLYKKCYRMFHFSSGKCTSECPVYKKNLDMRSNYQFEKIVTTNSGQKRYMQVSTYPLYENDKIAGTIVIMQDNTRLHEYESLNIKTRRQLEEELRLRKKLEESLRRSEAMYKAMFEHTGTAMLVINEDRTIAMANRKVEVITGYRIEDILGRRWDEFVHPGDVKWMMKYHLDRRQEGTKVPNHYEFRLIDANGKIKDIYYSIAMIPGTGQSIGSMIDITKRKQMERELRESREKYKQLLENIEDVFYEVDLFGNFIFLNDAVNRVFGIPRKQLIGCNFRELTDSKNAKKIYQAYNKILTTGVPERRIPWVVYNPKGEKIYVEVSASPIRNASGKITGFMGTVRDVTERIRFEQRLRFLSMHDVLTGLYNRAYFEEEMQRLQKSRHFPVSVISGDLDGLKAVNDTMGHKKGDELLQATANTLKKSIRAGDVAARVGGDEFVIILPETGSDTVEKIVKRIRASIDEYNKLNPDLPISISLGWATAESPSEISGLYKQADDNMYREKIYKKKHKKKTVS